MAHSSTTIKHNILGTASFFQIMETLVERGGREVLFRFYIPSCEGVTNGAKIGV